MFPESEKFVNELAVSFGGRDEWLQDEELCQNQTEIQAMMTSIARTQSETLLELMKQNPTIKCMPVAIPVAQQVEEAGEKPGNGNALVPSGGSVSAGMDEALGLEIDSWTSVVVDGSVKVLRALGSSSKANELVQLLKCCYEAEDGGVQVTTVAMLVLGLASVVDSMFAVSGKQMTVQTENVAALMPRLPSKKHFQRVDSGTKLMSSIGAIRPKRAKTRIQLQKREGRRRCELCRVVSPCVRECQCTTDMYFTADEFNRELPHDLDLQ